MAITLRELDTLEFPETGKRERGYSADAVDAFKARVRDELVEAYTRLQEVEQQLETARTDLLEATSELTNTRQALNDKPQVVDQPTAVATQSAELLSRAEALANEHVRNAEVTANAHVAEAEAVLRRAQVEASAHTEARLAEVQEKTNALVASKKREFAEIDESVAALRTEENQVRERLRAYFSARLEELDETSLLAGE